MLFQIVFSTRVLRGGVRTSFIQEEQQDLQYDPTTSAIDVLEVVSIYPDILILEIFEVAFEHPPFLPGCTPTLRQLLIRHNRVVEQ